LKALVVHEGRSMQQGHFTAFGRAPATTGTTAGTTASDWLFFSDDRVRQASEEEARSAQPYILFYQRDV
jgi:uncharacterized UBP type Zn finger protein